MARERIRPKARTGSSGFTLVETMVAVGLALVIMSVVIVVFRQGLALFRRTRALTEAVHSAQVAIDFMEQDIQSALRPANGRVFIGVKTSKDADDDFRGKIDNNGDGTFDEAPTIGEKKDSVDFLNTPGIMERHGLEMVTMSLFAMDDEGNPVAGEHVLYYLTRDAATENGNEMGRLIRLARPRGAAIVDTWLEPTDPGGWPSVGPPADPPPPTPPPNSELGPQAVRTMAFGVIQFKLRYFRDGVWYDAWDSTDKPGDPDGYGYGANGEDDDPIGAGVGGDDVQWRELPEVVEVTLQVVDESGYLDREEATPLVIQRLIQIVAVEQP